jgi:hypothetical protein
VFLKLAEHGSDDEDGVKHHPFQVNERPLPNPMGLSAFRGGLNSMAPRNALTLATMTPAMRDAAISHRLSEFPVSSGNAHRVKVSTGRIEIMDLGYQILQIRILLLAVT